MNTAHLVATDLNLLVVLDALLRTRSTTAAARRLGRTQSAVSHALNRLRTQLGDPLFVRAGSALAPTSLAEQLEAPLRDVLAGAAALVSRSAAGFEPARLERTFVLGGTDFAEIVLLPHLVPVVRREAPGVQIECRFLGDDIERALQRRDADLALGTRFRDAAGLVVETVARETMVAVVRRGHPALTRGALTLDAYVSLDHALVTPRGLPGGSVDEVLLPLRRRRRVVLRLPHFAAAALVVARTDLVVTLPSSLARAMAALAALHLAPLPFTMRPFAYALAYSAALARDRAHAWFRAHVAAAVLAGGMTPVRAAR